ncbi:GNAT family N-acetyltransferase [Streptomyces vastus]|uniref:N-acetyltransferase domain-containing protein n=1 Tax=Streptomyces vastus TaxID=285451 RepID=A0ABN3R1A6_9ACTN
MRDLLVGTVEVRDLRHLDLYLEAPSPANRYGIGLAAEEDGEVVGAACGAGIALGLAGMPISEEEVQHRIGLVDFLTVHVEHRRQGLGARLHDALLNGLRDSGHRLVLGKMAADRRDLVPVYTHWGWSVGARGAGVVVDFLGDPIALAEEPTLRVAWKSLTPGVHLAPLGRLGVPAVTGVFYKRPTTA